MTNQISEERLRNTRAWAAARVGQMSGADVIVGAIDEALAQRSLLGQHPERAKLCDDGHAPIVHFDVCPVCQLQEDVQELTCGDPRLVSSSDEPTAAQNDPKDGSG